MRILGIETSFDETAAAVMEYEKSGEKGIKILSNVLATSQEMHAKTGGAIPEIAARQQIKSVIPVINQAFKEAKLKPPEIDAIALTVGPGLIGSLLVGVETAKTLSWIWGKPIIPVNHLVGHLYANWINDNPSWVEPQFPAIGLVVSGGHTDLVLMQDHHKIELLGSTRDDAAGEAFDKTARLLSLPYPGGPSIAMAAEKYLETASPNTPLDLFPRPLIKDPTFDFSFSGLKTAVLRLTQKANQNARHTTFRLAAEIQEAIADVLIHKSMRAISKYNPKSFLLAGGVASNSRLRKKLQDEFNQKRIGVSFHVPSPSLCTDNAAYIAAAAFFSKEAQSYKDINATPQLTISDIVV